MVTDFKSNTLIPPITRNVLLGITKTSPMMDFKNLFCYLFLNPPGVREARVVLRRLPLSQATSLAKSSGCPPSSSKLISLQLTVSSSGRLTEMRSCMDIITLRPCIYSRLQLGVRLIKTNEPNIIHFTSK